MSIEGDTESEVSYNIKKTKRVMTEKQLENLKRGREKGLTKIIEWSKNNKLENNIKKQHKEIIKELKHDDGSKKSTLCGVLQYQR